MSRREAVTIQVASAGVAVAKAVQKLANPERKEIGCVVSDLEEVETLIQLALKVIKES